MKYGLPYQGSKSRIAKWVIDVLPRSHTLVDLFAGGCAVTHAALLNGKFDRIIANDVTDAPKVFLDAANGEYRDFSTVITRDDFFETNDTALEILYSFDNTRDAYLWSAELESFKVPATKMLTAPSLHERRMAYRDFCKRFLEFVAGGGRGFYVLATNRAVTQYAEP